MKWGVRLFALAKSDTGYIHNITANYWKVMGDVCNLPYSENLFISRIVLSLMVRLWLSVSGFEDYHHFTDRYYSSVSWLKNWTIENVKTHLAF
jgi:hypothetical protein